MTVGDYEMFTEMLIASLGEFGVQTITSLSKNMGLNRLARQILYESHWKVSLCQLDWVQCLGWYMSALGSMVAQW